MKVRANWQLRSNCGGKDPEAFFPDNGRTPRSAVSPCATCPVKQECLEFALNAPWEPYGPWGGLMQTEVQELWAARHPRNRGNEDRVLAYLGLASSADFARS